MSPLNDERRPREGRRRDVLLTGENKTECIAPVEFVQDRICPIACTGVRCVFACPTEVAS